MPIQSASRALFWVNVMESHLQSNDTYRVKGVTSTAVHDTRFGHRNTPVFLVNLQPWRIFKIRLLSRVSDVVQDSPNPLKSKKPEKTLFIGDFCPQKIVGK